jgi:hypothetical protein
LAASLWRVLDIKGQLRSDLPCDDWKGVAGAANLSRCELKGIERIEILKIGY